MICPRHKHCAYTGTEPGRCPICHATVAKCAGAHGQAPADGSWRKGAVAKALNPTLWAGQALHPQEAAEVSSSWPQAAGAASISDPREAIAA